MRSKLLGCLAVVLVLANSAQAESDFLTAMKRTLSAYKAGNFQEAAQELQAAQQFLNQDLLDLLKTNLPGPFGDWQADEAEGTTAGTMVMAGISAKRHFYKPNSDEEVQVELVANSPMLAGISMMFTNPMMMAAAGQGKLVTIGGHRCLQKMDPKSGAGELVFLPGASMMVRIEGTGIKSIKALYPFAERTKLDQLQKQFP